MGPCPDEAALYKLSQLVRNQTAIAPAELVDTLQVGAIRCQDAQCACMYQGSHTLEACKTEAA